MFKNLNITNKRGFTLVEILVVAVIIALLASAVFYGYTQFARQGRDSRRVLDLSNIQKGLEVYYSRSLSYPSGDYSAMVSSLQGVGISQVPQDPLPGKAYEYAVSTDGQQYVLKATLEVPDSPLFNNDLDGTVLNIGCGDASPTSGYCIGS